MSFWSQIGRWIDSVFGTGDPPTDVAPEKIEAAIQLIQSAVEDEQRTRQVRKLRVEDLSPERRELLARELSQVLKKAQPEE
ncbi:MAG TPA: hypothetical protein VFZ25_20830 [Chloroflexota bacterium]|nr:hypothetical protein [Chloroflexota bacterium]